MVPYLHTKDGITVVLFGQPFHAAKDDPIYSDVINALSSGEQAILDVFERAAQKVQQAVKLSPNLEYNGGVVSYKGEVLANYAIDKLVELLQAELDVSPLVNFIENLMQNPSKRVVDDLYRFLEKGKIPLTNDGHFLAYKKVRKDYKDIHSGRFENTVGAKFEMPRNRVDEDASRTCSTGFHVCSFDYLPNFGSTGVGDDRVMVCKINPADVVAIPADYNDTKMRVYRYEVTDEVTDYFAKNDNVLTKTPVSAAARDYAILGYEDYLEQPEEEGRFWTKEEAIAEAAELYNNNGFYQKVEVEQVSTGQIVHTLGS